MRAYAEQDEENLRARKLLNEWKNENLLSEAQYQQLQRDTPTELRTTNIFLRLVLLFFTLLAIGTAVALFFELMGVRTSGSSAGFISTIFAGLSYFAAETVVSRTQWYRHGVEEAFAIASVVLLCMGIEFIFFSGHTLRSEQQNALLVCVAGALSSLWIWYRFGLPYAFPAAMIFGAIALEQLTQSHAVQRCVLVVLYAGGLAGVAAVVSRHRFDYLRQRYSLAEAFLWLGIYLTLNLKLSDISTPAHLLSGTTIRNTHFSAPFYWTTWVLLWCLPPLILARAFRGKDRFVLAVGMLAAVLTLLTNKPYLGWQRHTWDPMLLGVALLAVAVFLLRWLARGPGGVRHGFTAASMSAKDKHLLGIASSVLGFVSPHSLTPASQPQASNAEFDSGFGGSSGGAGASGEF